MDGGRLDKDRPSSRLLSFPRLCGSEKRTRHCIPKRSVVARSWLFERTGSASLPSFATASMDIGGDDRRILSGFSEIPGGAHRHDPAS
jgi:hypothetical protein